MLSVASRPLKVFEAAQGDGLLELVLDVGDLIEGSLGEQCIGSNALRNRSVISSGVPPASFRGRVRREWTEDQGQNLGPPEWKPVRSLNEREREFLRAQWIGLTTGLFKADADARWAGSIEANHLAALTRRSARESARTTGPSRCDPSSWEPEGRRAPSPTPEEESKGRGSRPSERRKGALRRRDNRTRIRLEAKDAELTRGRDLVPPERGAHAKARAGPSPDRRPRRERPDGATKAASPPRPRPRKTGRFSRGPEVASPLEGSRS